MNTELFSVDRRGFYKVGGTLDLSTENPLGYSLLSVENFIAPEKLAAHLQILFPNGLSLHGWDFMTRHQDWTDHSKSNSYTIYDCTLEIMLEYVRRAVFPERPSRLQSYFAFVSVDAAKAFRIAEQPIYRLHADTVLRLDQRWLSHGDQSVIASYCAHNYWSGAAAPEPNWEYMLVPPVRVLERVE